MRTVRDFNGEYAYGCWRREEAAVAPVRETLVRNAVFYALLLGVVIFAFVRSSGDGGAGKRFGPLAYNTVLTSSMASVYPVGSLVVSWTVKEGEAVSAGLEGGDDIVFTRGDGTVVVHRIIEVLEDYGDDGRRGFRTQGVNNTAADPDITDERNVVGRVVWSVPYAGAALAFIAGHIAGVVAAVILFSAVFSLWKAATKKETSE
jgi:signal peptidase